MQIYTDDDVLVEGAILLKDGKIAEFNQIIANENDCAVMEFPKTYKALPGFIDLHIHGAAGADVMDATQEALVTMASVLPEEGTTSFLATTMTQSEQAIERALENAAEYIKSHECPGRAEVLGVHLEGPFVNPTKAGAQPAEYMQAPSQSLFDKWQQLSGQSIRLVTLAPELKGGQSFITHLCGQGVVASIGHSDATYDEFEAAVEAGATHVTHLYNQMRGLHHREPGVVGGTFLNKKVRAEMIVDGIHVDARMVKLAYEQKKADGLLLITDAMRAKCLGDGTYDLGGQEVIVKGKQATLADGTLAGSILKLKDAAWNMMAFTGCSLREVVQMASVNPAKQIGVYDRKGSLTVGKDADILILNEQNELICTICRGEVAYRKDVDSR